MSRVRWCRVLSLVPVAVVVGSPGLYVGDRWQRQLRGSSRMSYLVGDGFEASWATRGCPMGGRGGGRVAWLDVCVR